MVIHFPDFSLAGESAGAVFAVAELAWVAKPLIDETRALPLAGGLSPRPFLEANPAGLCGKLPAVHASSDCARRRRQLCATPKAQLAYTVDHSGSRT